MPYTRYLGNVFGKQIDGVIVEVGTVYGF